MPDLEVIRVRPRRLSRWERFKDAVRSYRTGPFSIADHNLTNWVGYSPSRSGVSVSEQTAMNYAAVWAAVNIVSSGVSSVPLALFRKIGDGKSKEEWTDHPVYRLIHDRPNPQMGSMVFRRTLQAHALVWGNGYAEIVRNEAGQPRALWPLLPYAVQPYIEGRQTLRYRCHQPNGDVLIVEAADILHVRGLTNDGVCGYSTIGNARDSLGLGMAAEHFGSTFFGNGSTFGGVIKYPPGVGTNPQVRKENREELNKRHHGVDNAHKLLALYEGADFQALGVPPNAAQFLETRQFQIEEVCRWFNVAPHKLHHLLRTSYNMIEHSAIEFDMDTLNPWWVLWEQELQMKLVPGLEQSQQKIEHVRQGRLQADVASRGTFYQTSFNVGAVTPNEIRGLENRNPITGGETAFVMNNLIPLALAEEYWKAEIEAKKAKAEPPPAPPAPDEDVSAARQRAQAAEDAADFARSELDRERGLHAETVRRAAETQAVQSEAVTRLEEERDALRDARILERTALEGERDAALGRLVEMQSAVTQAETARDTAQTALTEAMEMGRVVSQALTDVQAELDTARGDLVRTQADTEIVRDAARTAAETAAAALATVRGDLEQQNVTVALLRAEVERLSQESEAHGAELARARADLASALDAARVFKTTLMTAMRALFVEATRWLLQKESDRARKQQATVEKFRTWVETFYDLHADHVRAAFRPAVGLWSTLTGRDPAMVLEQIVAAHIERSQRELRIVLLADDEDERAAMLERTLGRWEQERAEAVADTLVQEGLQHGD